MKRVTKAVLAITAGVLAVAAGGNWTTTVTETDGGHLIGNPEAKDKLIEFVSYTCSHCANFARGGDNALNLAYIGSGKMQVEVRHIVRDPVDLVAAMLTHCGEPSKFRMNHSAFMLSQDTWLPIAAKATPAQQALWSGPNKAAGRRALASSLGFYKIMERRGYRRPDVDRCLADNAKAADLAYNTRKDATNYGIQGTPSFVLNGELLQDVHNWPTLEKALNKHAAEKQGS